MKLLMPIKLSVFQARMLIGIIVLSVIIISLIPVSVTFNVRALTQAASFIADDSFRSEWRFENALIRKGEDENSSAFSGVLKVLPGSNVTISRIGNGNLNINISGIREEDTIAKILADGSDEWLTIANRLYLALPDSSLTGLDHTMSIFPFTGTIRIGADIPDRITSQPLLLIEGKVTMLSHVFIGTNKYEAGNSQLELGDKLTVEGDGVPFGTIIVGSDPNLTIMCRVVAKKLAVHRFGSVGYTLSTSLFSRIQNDPLVQIIWATSLFLIGFLLLWLKKEA